MWGISTIGIVYQIKNRKSAFLISYFDATQGDNKKFHLKILSASDCLYFLIPHEYPVPCLA